MTASEPEPFKVIDRRGQPKEERKPAFPPGACTDIQKTEDPYKLVAILPGNCIPEREFKITDQEKYGFLLLGRSAKNVGPKGQKAIAAARKRIMGVIRDAVRDHSARQGMAEPSRVAEGRRTQ